MCLNGRALRRPSLPSQIIRRAYAEHSLDQKRRDVYEAALEHPTASLEVGQLEGGEILSGTPDALWASEGVIVWLVVEPQW